MLHGYFDLPTFTFFEEKNIWTGSLFREFNYRIMSKSTDDGSELYSVVWDGMKCFDLIDKSEYKAEFHEENSPDGLEKTIEKLNKTADEYRANGGKFA